MPITISSLLGISEGTTAEWESLLVPIPDKVLAYATDTKLIKRGDGEHLWNQLDTFIDIAGLEYVIGYIANMPSLSEERNGDSLLLTYDNSSKSYNIAQYPPPGVTFLWWDEQIPTGYIALEGAWLNKTTYSNIYSVLGNKFGSTDTHFKTPDTRGRFLRVWDNGAGVDPDSNNRSDRGDGVTGDNIGTLQSDEIRSHTHDVLAESGYTQLQNGTNEHIRFWTQSAYLNNTNTLNTGGAETRATNIYVCLIMKY